VGIRQAGASNETKSNAVGCGCDRNKAIRWALRGAVADDKEVVIVVGQLLRAWELAAQNFARGSNHSLMPRLKLSDEALELLLSLRLQRSYEPGTKRARTKRQSHSAVLPTPGESGKKKTPVATGAFLSRSYSSSGSPAKVTRDCYLAWIRSNNFFEVVVATTLISHCSQNLTTASY